MKPTQTHVTDKAQRSVKPAGRKGQAAPGPSMARRRGDELGADLPADPYREEQKPPSPVVCPDCRAVFQRGRWVWAQEPGKAAAHVCPACLRIRERQPAGYLYLRGGFVAEHRKALLRLLSNEEAEEKSRHPLQRIMQIRDAEGGLEVTTTDVHLARRLGEALQRAFQGALDIRQQAGEYLVRVYWQR